MLLLWTFLLLLLLLLTGAWGQSGDGDSDMEPTVSCTSHISVYEGSTITCQLVPGPYDLDDDEDNDNDTIKTITACCCQLGKNMPRCVEASGETVRSKKLNSNSIINLTVLSTRGRHVQTQLDLRKIIKPKSPNVSNVTLNQDNAVIHIQIPYHKDYLELENLQFQLQLWSDKSNMTHNMTSDSMNIGMDHLHKGTQYHVKVRAIPVNYLQGTWSKWSHTYSFQMPSADVARSVNILLWSIIPLVVVIISVVFLWKNKILTYMWPSIPHPKTTLVQICRSNNGHLMTHNPEELSFLNINPVDQSEAASHGETQSVPSLSTGGSEETPSSTQTTHTSISSVPTEELELLSQSSSSDGEQGVPSPTQAVTVQYEGDMFTSGQQEDSYVTMSNFYQIRTNGMLIRANTHPQI